MFRNYRAFLLCLTTSVGLAVQAMPQHKNRVATYRDDLGFSLALIRTLDKEQEEKAKRKRPRHTKYYATQSKKKDHILNRWVGGEIKRLKAQKELECRCRENMIREFSRVDDAREQAQGHADHEVHDFAAAIEGQMADAVGYEIDLDGWLEEQYDIQDNAQQEIWV